MNRIQERLFEIQPTPIPGLNDHYINGQKVTRMAYVVAFRRLFLEDAVVQRVRVTIEPRETEKEDGDSAAQAQQTEKHMHRSPHPRLTHISSANDLPPGWGQVQWPPRRNGQVHQEEDLPDA